MTKHNRFAGRLKKVSALPADAVDGDEVFLTTTHAIMRYNGTNWVGARLTTTSTSTTTTSTSTTTTSTSTT